MARTIDASSVASEERLDFWRSTVCDEFVPLRVVPQDAETLRGVVRADAVGDVQLREIAASAHVIDRTPRLIKSADDDYYKVALARRGRALVWQDGREAVVGPGDFVLYDSTRPYGFRMDTDFAFRICMVPKRLLPLRADALAAATAVRIDATRGAGALLPPFLDRLCGHAGELGPGEQEPVARTVADLICAVVTGCAAPAAPRNVHLARARAYIEAHLGDASLSPRAIAAACAISPSYLHRIFAEAGTTVAEYVRERRLQGCWRDLAAPAYAHLTITAVGARWGMPDPATLSRSFRARFGLTPSEHRAACRSPRIPQPDDPPGRPGTTAGRAAWGSVGSPACSAGVGSRPCHQGGDAVWSPSGSSTGCTAATRS